MKAVGSAKGSKQFSPIYASPAAPLSEPVKAETVQSAVAKKSGGKKKKSSGQSKKNSSADYQGKKKK
ncbi:MAG: hypothetical protein II086_00555 [Ruminococcus sp.]|nr:hypothetical protein [Ruminococcus sp.]